MMGFFITISMTILSPFQCQAHPNESWTVLQYEGQLCWEEGDHMTMIILAVLALSVPVGFLSWVTYLLRIFPRKMRSGDALFLHTYAFLFLRIKPWARYFMLAYLLRNLSIAVIALIPNGFWQTILMQFVFMSTCLVTAGFRPWRLRVVNILEVVINFCLLQLMCLAAFF